MTRNLKALGLALVAVFAMSAFIASAAQASPVVTTTNNGTTLKTKSIGVQKFIVNPGAENESKLECSELTGDATVNNGASSITLGEIVYEEDCTAHVGEQTLPVIVDMNGCHYTLHGGEAEGTHHFVNGLLDITGCTGTGPTITIKNATTTATLCTYTVWATNNLSPITATNTTNASGADDIDVVANGVTVDTTKSQGLLCPQATNSHAFYYGEITVTATASGSATDVTLSE